MQIREERNLLDIKRIENLIVSMNVKKILDFGCGIGADGVRFARDFDVEVTFSDIVESNVKLAARHSKIFNINSKAILLDNSEKFIFPEVYDMIFSNGVLHHIPNASGVVSNLRKYLKSDGLFVAMLYTPKGYTESGAKNLVEFRALSEGRMPRKANVYNPYSTFYDEKDAKELFAGFELIESYKTYNGLYGWYVFRRS